MSLIRFLMALCFSCKHKPGDKYKLKGHIRQRGRDKWVRQLEYIRRYLFDKYFKTIKWCCLLMCRLDDFNYCIWNSRFNSFLIITPLYQGNKSYGVSYQLGDMYLICRRFFMFLHRIWKFTLGSFFPSFFFNNLIICVTVVKSVQNSKL